MNRSENMNMNMNMSNGENGYNGNTGRRNKTAKERLLYRLQVCDFALHECALYLDEHPYDPAALQYYERQKALHRELSEDYIKRYGPITYFDNQNQNEWEWAKGPWPWELNENGEEE